MAGDTEEDKESLAKDSGYYYDKASGDMYYSQELYEKSLDKAMVEDGIASFDQAIISNTQVNFILSHLKTVMPQREDARYTLPAEIIQAPSSINVAGSMRNAINKVLEQVAEYQLDPNQVMTEIAGSFSYLNFEYWHGINDLDLRIFVPSDWPASVELKGESVDLRQALEKAVKEELKSIPKEVNVRVFGLDTLSYKNVRFSTFYAPHKIYFADQKLLDSVLADIKSYSKDYYKNTLLLYLSLWNGVKVSGQDPLKVAKRLYELAQMRSDQQELSALYNLITALIDNRIDLTDAQKTIDISIGKAEPTFSGSEISGFAAEFDKALLVEDRQFQKGGIDFNPSNLDLEVQNEGGSLKFEINPAQLQQLQNAPGFVPVIINIQPLQNLQLFLGVKESEQKIAYSDT